MFSLVQKSNVLLHCFSPVDLLCLLWVMEVGPVKQVLEVAICDRGDMSVIYLFFLSPVLLYFKSRALASVFGGPVAVPTKPLALTLPLRRVKTACQNLDHSPSLFKLLPGKVPLWSLSSPPCGRICSFLVLPWEHSRAQESYNTWIIFNLTCCDLA